MVADRNIGGGYSAIAAAYRDIRVKPAIENHYPLKKDRLEGK